VNGGDAFLRIAAPAEKRAHGVHPRHRMADECVRMGQGEGRSDDFFVDHPFGAQILLIGRHGRWFWWRPVDATPWDVADRDGEAQ